LARLTLVSRSYCHLCTEMEAALRPLLVEFGADLDVVDVDTDADLLRLYDELVPVLLHADIELCHYRVEPTKVRDYLSKIG